MRALLTLIRREFTAYFLSPVAYVTLAGFLIVTGRLFTLTMVALTEGGPQGVEYPVQGVFGGDAFWLFFVLMRLLAEERGAGTLEMLLTAPIRDWQVVAGKYVGALLFYVVMLLPTLVYVPVLVNLDWETLRPRIDPMPVATTYAGLLAAGAMFLAIGLFLSSLVKSQLVAAMVSLLVSLPFVVAAFWQPDLDANSLAARVVAFVSVPEHFRRDFTRGVIDTRHLVLYGSVAAFCLYLTCVSLEARRLRA
jgi:ABC-2 type transport system permease protein